MDVCQARGERGAGSTTCATRRVRASWNGEHLCGGCRDCWLECWHKPKMAKRYSHIGTDAQRLAVASLDGSEIPGARTEGNCDQLRKSPSAASHSFHDHLRRQSSITLPTLCPILCPRSHELNSPGADSVCVDISDQSRWRVESATVISRLYCLRYLTGKPLRRLASSVGATFPIRASSTAVSLTLVSVRQ